MQPSTFPAVMAPQKLSWVTVPLIINMVLGVLGLLALPFMGALINTVFATSPTDGPGDIEGLQLARLFSGATLWFVGIIGILSLILYWYSYKSLQEGKSVGRIIAIVLAILGLFNFPIGTLLSIFMLIGAFDAEVTNYARR